MWNLFSFFPFWYVLLTTLLKYYNLQLLIGHYLLQIFRQHCLAEQTYTCTTTCVLDRKLQSSWYLEYCKYADKWTIPHLYLCWIRCPSPLSVSERFATECCMYLWYKSSSCKRKFQLGYFHYVWGWGRVGVTVSAHWIWCHVCGNHLKTVRKRSSDSKVCEGKLWYSSPTHVFVQVSSILCWINRG